MILLGFERKLNKDRETGAPSIVAFSIILGMAQFSPIYSELQTHFLIDDERFWFVPALKHLCFSTFIK